MRFIPTTAAEVRDMIAWAAAEEQPLELLGSGSKRGIGHSLETEHALDMSRLSSITLYEPEELVLSAKAGTPLADIETELAANGQQFAFEPMDYGPLLGGTSGHGTIGGVLAANLSGPRRLKSGAARDHILGIKAVSGRGEAFKSGGRVVKNVTGYDLSKAMAGSWGTLAAVTDVTFKVLPAAQTETTLALRGLLDEVAASVMASAVGSSGDVSSAAHLPEGVAGSVLKGELGADPATLLRIEGFAPSVAYRSELLKALFSAAEIEELHDEDSRRLWRDIRDCIPFADGTAKPIWRVSVAPSEGHRLALALRMQVPATVFYDWQGGLLWIRIEGPDPEAALLRSLIPGFGGGHATLVRAAEDVRKTIPVFQPQTAPLAALSMRLKAEFDPKGVLNPGRMFTAA